MKNLTFPILLLILACSIPKTATKATTYPLLDNRTFKLTEISSDKSYGYSQKNAVQVGGAKDQIGPTNERRFLNALTGPNGEQISYYRAGSCCAVKSKNAPFGDKVLLDNYRVTYQGWGDTVSIYINMYDTGELKAPVGFKFKK